MTIPPPENTPAEQMPEGWYDDPFTDHLQRYWTGATWTKQTRPRVPPQSPPDPFVFGSGGPPSDGSLIIKAPAPPEGAPIIVRDYLVLSILSLVFCFWPLAIPAVYFAIRTYSAKKSGDIEAALRYSDRARLFLILSVIAGILVGAYLAWTVMG
jgi:hypothetical protein